MDDIQNEQFKFKQFMISTTLSIQVKNGLDYS